MASYASVNIFGTQVSMSTSDNPRGAQKNAFPGLSGVESLDQGLRGRFTNVVGRLAGVDQFDLAGAEELFRSYNDGNSYTLVDTNGTTWLNVKLESFEPQGKVQTIGGSGYVMRKYAARFEHLT